LENTSPPPGGISADVVWGGKYDKGEEKIEENGEKTKNNGEAEV
jgi:hypothetical protein